MASTYLSATLGTATNRKKWTFSAWVKKSRPQASIDEMIFGSYADASTSWYSRLADNGSNKFEFTEYSGSAYTINLRPTNKQRDVHGWYHIVIGYDSTQATASNRVKFYINGEQVTSWTNEDYPAQNYESGINKNQLHTIGKSTSANNYYYDGSMSHIHFIDGTQYAASDFGSTDATTGEWKINTSPSVTYGNNGWFIFKDNASVTDQSGEGNNWTVTAGSVTPTQDNPSNIFCTLNPLATGNSKPTFSKGANRVVGTATSYQFSCGTIAVPLTGKWYWEVKANNNVNGSNSEYLIGAVLESRLEASGNFAEFAADGITQYGSVGTGIAQNDIIGVSVDRTAATLKIYKNNSLILTKSSLPAELLYPLVTVYGSGIGADANFGNGYFGGSAVSSAGTNASNNGIFEYDVIPSDANALSTKGLNL